MIISPPLEYTSLVDEIDLRLLLVTTIVLMNPASANCVIEYPLKLLWLSTIPYKDIFISPPIPNLGGMLMEQL